MLMSPSPKSYDMPLEINDADIERMEKFLYLGIDLDPKLRYKNHIPRIAAKQAIGALCRTILKWTPKYIFGVLYKSLIEPLMTYAIEAWYPTQIVLQNSIERVNKFAIKLTLIDFSSTYTSLLERLKWKPISRTAME
uniref:Reverse transcriptase domain-containing protein n=1 Tax=Acrobeloides nanus TaxID=290746 RepID=A0A914DCM0_9BILA